MKVAIIGAGINGLYLAWKLSESSRKVTVFEKKEKIGKQACSGLFSERILKFIPESKKLIQNQIKAVLIHFPKRTFHIRFQKKFFIMNHTQLDRLVAGLAKRAGAKIILKNPVNSLPTEFPFMEAKEKKRTKSSSPEGFDRIIGCDGYNSFVRKKLGLGKPIFRATIQGFLKKENYSDCVETWPVEEGFIWKIPRGEMTEYGVMTKPEKAKKLFKEFLNKNKLQLQRIQGSVVPQGFAVPKNSTITLCGDAVGLTKPWSGGGVAWGLIAANLLLKNFPDFLKYQKELKRFFLARITFSKIATKMVYLMGFNFPWLLPKEVTIEGDFLL